jgi:ribosomal protein S18 acetylase RimI-like enzyme
MKLQLRPAQEADFAFCASLSRSNMAPYHSARGIAWDSGRFLATWAQFETSVLCADDVRAGLLALLLVDGALEIRDLQVASTHRSRGIGTWAIAQAKSEAASRGLEALRLRVYADNPARHLYARLGFQVDSTDGDVLHMSYRLPPGDPSGPTPRRHPT